MAETETSGIKICTRKGCDVILEYLCDCSHEKCWRVTYAGNGKYFTELDEVAEYLVKRKFVREGDKNASVTLQEALSKCRALIAKSLAGKAQKD